MISLWDYYVAANEIHRWVQELEDTLGVEVKRSAPVYEALSKVRDVAFDDIDARGVAAEQENARLRVENNGLKQAIFYVRQGLAEIEVENAHGRSRLRLRRKRADHRVSACARPAARRG